MPVAVAPLIYSAAMSAEVIAALATGWLYDRIKGRVLLILPILVTAVPALAFAGAPAIAITGVLIWGTAVGIQDSTVKALVADLTPTTRRATAYGIFAAIQGAAAIIGGAIAGALYERSTPALIASVAITQIMALTLLITTLRRQQRD